MRNQGLFSQIAPLTTSFSSTPENNPNSASSQRTPHSVRKLNAGVDEDVVNPLLQPTAEEQELHSEEEEEEENLENHEVGNSRAPLAGRSLLPSIPLIRKNKMLTEGSGELGDGEGQDVPSKLSFWQHHFTKPTSINSKPRSTPSTSSLATSEDAASSQQKPPPSSDSINPRRFSFRSKGSLLVIFFLTMVLIATVITVLAITLTHHGEAQSSHSVTDLQHPGVHPVDSSNSSEISQSMAFAFSKKPVRLGVLENFPDPSIYYDADKKTWYAFGTNDAAGVLRMKHPDASTISTSKANVQMATSSDFESWSLLDDSSDPLGTLGAWVDTAEVQFEMDQKMKSDATHKPDKNQPQGIAVANVWAPDVLHRPSDNKWVLYYSALEIQHHTHCVGAAVASDIPGPYQPLDTPFACPFRRGGAIDPVGFIDIDPTTKQPTIYVAYKIDGNSRGHGGECGNSIAPIVPTPIMLQKMQPDGITPDGEPVQILDRIAADGPLVEAPALAKVGGKYFLFYSSGCTRSPDYTVRYAYADNINGPYTRAPHNGKLLNTGDYGLLAPGSCSVRFAPDLTTDEVDVDTGSSDAPGTWKIALHGRVDTSEGGIRAMFTAGLQFDGTKINIVNATIIEGS